MPSLPPFCVKDAYFNLTGRSIFIRPEHIGQYPGLALAFFLIESMK